MRFSARVDDVSPFANRVDQKITHHYPEKLELPDRKPDQVFGLRRSKTFMEYIPSLRTTSKSKWHWGYRYLREVEVSAFKQDEIDPEKCMILPFLIAEAKSERGNNFRSCQEQTAFPIYRLLSLQEELESRSGMLLVEQGGPLVWFFANRGHIWTLYGCYIVKQDRGETSYVCYYVLNEFLSLHLVGLTHHRRYTSSGSEIYQPAMAHCRFYSLLTISSTGLWISTVQVCFDS